MEADKEEDVDRKGTEEALEDRWGAPEEERKGDSVNPVEGATAKEEEDLEKDGERGDLGAK